MQDITIIIDLTHVNVTNDDNTIHNVLYVHVTCDLTCTDSSCNRSNKVCSTLLLHNI